MVPIGSPKTHPLICSLFPPPLYMVKILSWTGNTLFDSEKPTLKESLQDAVLRGADLRGADLQDAVLRGAVLTEGGEKALEPYFKLCARDILFVFHYCAAEVPFLREKLIKGEIDGTQYKGECACLIGSLANADGGLDKVCSTIPFYERGLENYGEQWFYNIRIGDTPKNSYFCKKAVELCDFFLSNK